MKKYNKKIKATILLIVFISFLSAPVHMTQANFNDSTTQLANLKLELGNIDLSFRDSVQMRTEEHSIESNHQTVTFNLPEIKNNGSLSGKLFFKVDIYQLQAGKEEYLTDETGSSNFKLNIKADNQEYETDVSMQDYQPILNQKSKPLILSPQDTALLSFSISAGDISNVEKYRVEYTFLMTQIDGTLSKPLFHDTISMTYHFKVKKDTIARSESKAATSFTKSTEKETYPFSKEITEENETKTEDEIILGSQEKIEGKTSDNQVESDLEQVETFKCLIMDEEFKVISIEKGDVIYEVSITQDQFNWLLQFATLEEFGNQITQKTPALYVKYDKVTGVEDIEQFVYDLAEQKQINFGINLVNYPKEKFLKITFTK